MWVKPWIMQRDDMGTYTLSVGLKIVNTLRFLATATHYSTTSLELVRKPSLKGRLQINLSAVTGSWQESANNVFEACIDFPLRYTSSIFVCDIIS